METLIIIVLAGIGGGLIRWTLELPFSKYIAFTFGLFFFIAACVLSMVGLSGIQS